MQKNKKREGRCIFCGGTGLSKQHVIPDWISNLLPSAEKHPQSSFSVTAVLDRNAPAVIAAPVITEKERNGPMHQRKVRNVCVACNGGWISQIESAAKPLLEKMILGIDLPLSKSDVKLLSLAIVIITIMSEYTDPNPNNIIIPELHRRFIYKNKRVPDGWYIGIGMMKELCVARPRHVNLSCAPFSNKYVAVGRSGYQVTTMTLGYLLVQSITLVNFEYPIYFSRDRYFKLWPDAAETDSWQQNLKPEAYDQFMTISDALTKVLMPFFLSKIPKI